MREVQDVTHPCGHVVRWTGAPAAFVRQVSEVVCLWCGAETGLKAPPGALMVFRSDGGVPIVPFTAERVDRVEEG